MKKFDEIVSKIEEGLLSFSVLAMATILIVGVIARAVFNSSLTFTEEIGQALNVIVTFLGIGYCAKKARHISMSIVFDFATTKIKKLMMCIITLITGIIMIYLTYLSIYYVLSVYELGRVTASLRIPMWLLYMPIPLGFGLGALEYLRAFVKNIQEKEEIYISSALKIGENMDDMGTNEEVHE